MDINCTDSCYYQEDGKCRLDSVDELAAAPQGFQMSAGGNSSDCPYRRCV